MRELLCCNCTQVKSKPAPSSSGVPQLKAPWAYSPGFKSTAALPTHRSPAAFPTTLAAPLQGDGSLLDNSLLSITSPGAPLLVYGRSNTHTSLPLSSFASLDDTLYDGYSEEAAADLRGEVDGAWRWVGWSWGA